MFAFYSFTALLEDVLKASTCYSKFLVGLVKNFEALEGFVGGVMCLQRFSQDLPQNGLLHKITR